MIFNRIDSYKLHKYLHNSIRSCIFAPETLSLCERRVRTHTLSLQRKNQIIWKNRRRKTRRRKVPTRKIRRTFSPESSSWMSFCPIDIITTQWRISLTRWTIVWRIWVVNPYLVVASRHFYCYLIPSSVILSHSVMYRLAIYVHRKKRKLGPHRWAIWKSTKNEASNNQC